MNKLQLSSAALFLGAAMFTMTPTFAADMPAGTDTGAAAKGQCAGIKQDDCGKVKDANWDDTKKMCMNISKTDCEGIKGGMYSDSTAAPSDGSAAPSSDTGTTDTQTPKE